MTINGKGNLFQKTPSMNLSFNKEIKQTLSDAYYIIESLDFDHRGGSDTILLETELSATWFFETKEKLKKIIENYK